jgi:RNA polymerase sigma-70 factor (ECF subfamily)
MTTGEGSTSTIDMASAAALPATAPDIRTLVDEHFGFIARSVRRLGVPEVDVDDASQQVFLVAANKLDRIVRGNEKAFLFGIALRVASESRRAWRRRAVREGAAAAESTTSVCETPEEIAENRQARALLDEILDTMPENVRAVFMLFELEEMTMAEIAKVLGVPPGSVASRLRRGRELFHSEAARRRDQFRSPP